MKIESTTILLAWCVSPPTTFSGLLHSGRTFCCYRQLSKASMTSGEEGEGSVSIPQAIAFKDRNKVTLNKTPARRSGPPKPDDENDLFSSSAATSSVSPLRSEPYSTGGGIGYSLDEVHILVKSIREQALKQPKKNDPPAWTQHLSQGSRVEKAKKKAVEEKRNDGSRKTASTVDTKEDKMVAQDSANDWKVSEQEEMYEVAEKAQKEIAELEALLAKQEEDAQRLAGRAAQIIAQLEAEADEKAKAAEEALRKAKKALQSVNENVKKDMSPAQNLVESAARGEGISEDREMTSPVSFTKELRQDHSYEDKEVSAINKDEVEIAEPPSIVRKGKSLTIVTDFEGKEDEAHDAVSPLRNDESPRKRISINEDGSTMDTIHKKIEECREMLLNPNASMDEQSKAAELMAKMARIAKITESLEPKKDSPDLISPLSCGNTADASHGEKSLHDIQKKIEECRQTLMNTELNISEHLNASEKMEALAKEALSARRDEQSAVEGVLSQDEQESQVEKWEPL